MVGYVIEITGQSVKSDKLGDVKMGAGWEPPLDDCAPPEEVSTFKAKVDAQLKKFADPIPPDATGLLRIKNDNYLLASSCIVGIGLFLITVIIYFASRCRDDGAQQETKLGPTCKREVGPAPLIVGGCLVFVSFFTGCCMSCKRSGQVDDLKAEALEGVREACKQLSSVAPNYTFTLEEVEFKGRTGSYYYMKATDDSDPTPDGGQKDIRIPQSMAFLVG